MTNETKNMETSVETVDINIDEIFDGAPSAEGVTLPEETKGNIFKNLEECKMRTSYDGDGHLVIGTKNHWFCLKCDVWYPLKYWRER